VTKINSNRSRITETPSFQAFGVNQTAQDGAYYTNQSFVAKEDSRIGSSFNHGVFKRKTKEEEVKPKISAREKPKPSLGIEGILDLEF